MTGFHAYIRAENSEIHLVHYKKHVQRIVTIVFKSLGMLTQTNMFQKHLNMLHNSHFYVVLAVIIDEATRFFVGPTGPRNDRLPRHTPGVNCRRTRIELSANHTRVLRGPKIFSGSESWPTNQFPAWAHKTRASYRSQSYWAHE